MLVSMNTVCTGTPAILAISAKPPRNPFTGGASCACPSGKQQQLLSLAQLGDRELGELDGRVVADVARHPHPAAQERVVPQLGLGDAHHPR